MNLRQVLWLTKKSQKENACRKKHQNYLEQSILCNKSEIPDRFRTLLLKIRKNTDKILGREWYMYIPSLIYMHISLDHYKEWFFHEALSYSSTLLCPLSRFVNWRICERHSRVLVKGQQLFGSIELVSVWASKWV